MTTASSTQHSTKGMLGQIVDDWNLFWFSNGSATAINRVRIGVSACTALWLISFFGSVEAWFGTDGLLPTTLSGKLIEFEESARWQHWSPLWWTDNVLVVRLYLAIAVVLAILSAVGVGGRVTITALLLLVIGWVHRITWLQGPLEPALVAMLAYLIVSPGQSLWKGSNGGEPMHWLHHLALRLVQVHCWGLIAIGVLSQLGNIVWWRGEAMWWLAASGRSQLLSLEFVGSSASLVNALTHGLVLIQLLTLGLLLNRSTRPLGLIAGLLSCVGIGLLADQTLYALLIAVGLMAFATPKETPK